MNNKFSTHEIEVLLNIVEKLEHLNIPYMLTGSLAMNYYAEPRMTRDIDLVVEIGTFHKKELFEIFNNEYYMSEVAFDEAIKFNSVFNIIHQNTVTKADLIIRKKDEYGIQAFNRRLKKKINDHFVYVISKEDLILSKIKWAFESESTLQRKDIINLLETDYDKEYVINWLQYNKLSDFAKEFIGERYFS